MGRACSHISPFCAHTCTDQADFLHADLKLTLDKIISKRHNCYDKLFSLYRFFLYTDRQTNRPTNIWVWPYLLKISSSKIFPKNVIFYANVCRQYYFIAADTQVQRNVDNIYNTPGTAGGSGFQNRILVVKSNTNGRNFDWIGSFVEPNYFFIRSGTEKSKISIPKSIVQDSVCLKDLWLRLLGFSYQL